MKFNFALNRLRKYSCRVLGAGSVISMRFSFVSGSMIPSWYIESTYVLIALVRGIVGSVSILSYMESSERWFSPSLTYCVFYDNT